MRVASGQTIAEYAAGRLKLADLGWAPERINKFAAALEEMVTAAVEQECEACAALAEYGGISADGDVGRQIAALIRTRNKTR